MKLQAFAFKEFSHRGVKVHVVAIDDGASTDSVDDHHEAVTARGPGGRHAASS
jgi:hypothetical protein